MAKELAGKSAIVTGAARGIGKAIALLLAEKGANVAIVDVLEDEANKTAAELKAKGTNAIVYKADVSNSTEVKSMVTRVWRTFGKIDILINNAGVTQFGPLVQTSEKDWDRTIDVNLKGTYLCTKSVLPHMIERASGTIVNISSALGLRGMGNYTAYSASKFGVIGLTKSLAEEVAQYDIRTYAVCPGGVYTPMFMSVSPNADPKTLLKPEAVAEAVVNLCLPYCRQRSGSIVEVHKGIWQ